ncbi:MAG: hypothetical protein CMM01_00975 [Rhodopirellula sp.]|nr:hypothetical protein [Rhodopirellula sp.]
MLTKFRTPRWGQIEYQNGKHSQGEIVPLAFASQQFVAFFAFDRGISRQSGQCQVLKQLQSDGFLQLQQFGRAQQPLRWDFLISILVPAST